MSQFKVLNLTSLHVVVSTMFFLLIFISTVYGSPIEPTQDNLLQLIQRKSKGCIFPPEKIKIPDKCSELTLESTLTEDLDGKGIVESYLCFALLDSVSRLCPLLSKNKAFGESAKMKLEDALPNIKLVGGVTFCGEMNDLDATTSMQQAKFFYNNMKDFCVALCTGYNENEKTLREPLCKSIQFAHQQIKTADDLQKSLNTQEQSNIHSPVEQRPASGSGINRQSSVVEGSHSVVQTLPENKEISPRKQEESLLSESAGAQDMKPVVENVPSQSQPAAGNAPVIKSNSTISKAVPAAIVPLKTDTAKVPHEKIAAEKDKIKVNDELGTKPEIPDAKEENGKVSKIEQPTLENAEDQPDAQGGADAVDDDGFPGIPPNNGPGDGGSLAGAVDPPAEAPEGNTDDAQQEASLTDNKEQTELQDPDVDNDGGLAETDEEAAAKPPPIEKKTPQIYVPMLPVQPKISQETMSGLNNFEETEDSHFFAYFLSITVLCALGYIVFHNKRKIIAMAVEGKKGRNTGRRRPNSASYHKLDSNLEEAMSSNLTSTNSYVIY